MSEQIPAVKLLNGVPETESAQAIVRDGMLLIRLPLDAFQTALDGAHDLGAIDGPWKVTDKEKFAQEVANALNEEDEQGTTMVHRMMDEAFQNAISMGAEGVEEAPGEDEEEE